MIFKRTNLSVTFAVALAAGLTTFAARAEDAPKPFPACGNAVPKEDTDAAKGLYQAGQASFKEADYDKASGYWEDAYARDCTAHLLLLNLAQVYELAGKRKHAVQALQTYLERVPDAQNKEQLKRRIEKLQEKIKAEETGAAAKPEPVKPVGPTQPEPGKGTVVEPPKSTSTSRPLWPLYVAGGGALVGIVGMAIYFPANKTVEDLRKLCDKDGNPSCNTKVPPTEATQGDVDKGNSARSKLLPGGLLAVAGLGTAIGFGIYYFVQPKPRPAAMEYRLRPVVTPEVGPGFAGLSVTGRF